MEVFPCLPGFFGCSSRCSWGAGNSSDAGCSWLWVSNKALYFFLCPPTLPWLIHVFLDANQQRTTFIHLMPAARRDLRSPVFFGRLGAVFVPQAGPTQRLLLGKQLPLLLGLGTHRNV